MIKKALFVTLLLFFTSGNIFSSGFQLNEHGAKAMAMSGAFTGLANDASAVYFNPGAITFLKGTNFMGGVTFIRPSSTFKGPKSTNPNLESELKSQFFTPINFYFTHSLSDRLSIGFSVNNPFGLGTKWEEDWVGRYGAVETEIRTFTFSPVVAYKISDQFSVGAGFQVSYGDVKITRSILGLLPNPVDPANLPPVMFPDPFLELSADDIGYGFAIGLFYKPTEQFSAGLNFRSEITYNFEGTADLEVDPSIEPATQGYINTALPNGDAKAELTTPMVIQAGIAYQPNDHFTVTADFQYNGWSSYEKLEIEFDTWKNPLTGSNLISSERDFENSFIVRLGNEYRVSKCLALRAGLLYDKNPVKDERLDSTLPDADRIGFNVGFGYNLTENLVVDVAYLYLHFVERTIDNSGEFIPIGPGVNEPLNGVYTSNAHLFGIDFSYSIN